MACDNEQVRVDALLKGQWNILRQIARLNAVPGVMILVIIICLPLVYFRYLVTQYIINVKAVMVFNFNVRIK